MATKNSAAAKTAAKTAAPAAPAATAAPAKPVYVARATTAKAKGKTVYLYGAAAAPAGVGSALVLGKGANFATYKPRTAQAACWAWFTAGKQVGTTVAACKLAAVAAGHKLAIAAMLRHAARSGAITLA